MFFHQNHLLFDDLGCITHIISSKKMKTLVYLMLNSVTIPVKIMKTTWDETRFAFKILFCKKAI